MEVKVEISASSSKSAVYGNDYTLTCLANTVESNPTLTNPLLQNFLTIDWLDRDNNSITTQDSLTVGNVSTEFSRTLYFHPLRRGHDRLYVCVATLDIPGAISVSTSQYRLILGKYRLKLTCIYSALCIDRMDFCTAIINILIYMQTLHIFS